MMTTDFSANVSLWLECNLKCPYCFGNPGQPPREWPAAIDRQLGQLEEFLNATGTWELDFSGGETTIHPGFGALCGRLADHGHEVMFFTNGVVPLSDVFPGDTATRLKRVTFSYHVSHEKSERLDRIFERNVAFLQERGVDVALNYVLYPDRRQLPAAIRERMEKLGLTMQFRAFQGEYEGRQYPFAYNEAELAEFTAVGDIRARFFMENGFLVPTFKRCRAGQETFYISLRTGGVYVCEQLQQKELANFQGEGAVERFREQVLAAPIACPAKRCTCRITVDQEDFLATHDPWDMQNYPAWERISRPTPEALAYWDQKEQGFADELAARLQGDEIHLWGAGVHSLILLRLLRDRGFPLARVRGIIDSNPLKRGERILGIDVLPPDQVGWRTGEGCSDILISSRAFEEEIYAGLVSEKATAVNVVRLYDGSLKHSYEALED